MQEGFIPKDRGRIVRWLLETAILNSWKIVLEYFPASMYKFLTEYATETTLPTTVEYHYSQNYILTAIVNPKITTKFINRLIKQFSVLSLHNNKEMVMLCADDFHPECFTCSAEFYKTYYPTLIQQGLVLE